MLPKGFCARALFPPMEPYRFRTMHVLFFGCWHRPPKGQHQDLSEPKGLECFRKGSVPEPFFTDEALSVLNGACFDFWVLVPAPIGSAPRPFRVEGFRMLPKGFCVRALFFTHGAWSILNRACFYFLSVGTDPQRVSTGTFQGRRVENASERVLCRSPFFTHGALSILNRACFDFWVLVPTPKGSAPRPFRVEGFRMLSKWFCV
jgi:hypothetical protein